MSCVKKKTDTGKKWHNTQDGGATQFFFTARYHQRINRNQRKTLGLHTQVVDCWANAGSASKHTLWQPSAMILACWRLEIQGTRVFHHGGQIHIQGPLLPSGYDSHSHGKSPINGGFNMFLAGKIIYKWSILYGYVSHNQMVNQLFIQHVSEFYLPIFPQKMIIHFDS